MEKDKEDIIDFLNNRGHTAYEFEPHVWAEINGIKTEWNWDIEQKGKDEGIVIGYGNSNEKDIPMLSNLIPSRFSKDIIQRPSKPNISFIIINNNKATPQDYYDIVSIIEKISPKSLQNKANPRKGKAIVHGLESRQNKNGSDSLPPMPLEHLNKDEEAKKHYGDCVQLTLDEINILNSLCGTGDYEKAEVLFFGNEEGLGGDPILKVINKRKHHFFNDYKTVDGFDRSNGHYYVDRSGDYYPINAEFLKYMARIMLYLSVSDGNWFELKEDDPESYKIIREYTKRKLCREKTGMKSALFELRPLPRLKEGRNYIWPYCQGYIIEKDYLDSFKFNNITTNSFHLQLATERLRILKNLICSSIAKYIIGFGAKDAKRRALEIMFPKISFVTHSIGSQKAHLATICICNRDIKILLCPFPGQNLSVVELKEAAAFI